MERNKRHHVFQKELKMLISIILPVTVLSLTLLWNFRVDGNVQMWVRPYRTSPATSAQPNSTETTEKPREDEMFIIRRMNGTKTLLISAYLEHRSKKKQVRVVAVASRQEQVSYVCKLCCEKKLHVFRGFATLHSDHFGYPYGTTDIACFLPSGCKTPTHVALVSDGKRSEGLKQAGDEHCSDKEGRGFMDVKNQQERLNSFPNNFVVCISVMYNFTNVLQFVQTLEMLQLLGVSRVVIYKTSCSVDMQLVLDYYTLKGLVEVIPWNMSTFLNVSRGFHPSVHPGDIQYFGQIPALNDCLYRYMYQSKWIAMHDLDELILPQSVDSWLELLPLLDKKHSNQACYKFENTIFPINVAESLPASQSVPQQPQWNNIAGVNILDHLYQMPIKTGRVTYKVIVNPRAVIATTVHGVIQPPGLCRWADKNVARIYHIKRLKKEPGENKMLYDGRLLNYISRLIPAVNAALRASGLLPEEG